MGAAGVALAAASAHAAPGQGLDSAAYMLLFHGAAILGGVSLLDRGLGWRLPLILALAFWIIGGALFSGDITLRAFTGNRIFPMAAPTGGMLLIAAWALLAISALGLAFRR